VTATSTSTTPELERIIAIVTPMTTKTMTTPPSASVRMRPVAAA